MITVFILSAPDAPALSPSLVFRPNYRTPFPDKRLFMRDIMSAYQTPFFNVVSGAHDADFFAVPFDYVDALWYAPRYLKAVYARAAACRKKVILFDYSDLADTAFPLPPHAVLFRVSAYRHHLTPQEIVMPYFVEDLGTRYAIAARRASVPTVGFCGQSLFPNRWRKWRARIKWWRQYARLQTAGDAMPSVHKRGIFWRQHALRVLRGVSVAVDVVERPFYSLHRTTALIPPETLRREYVENLRRNDLALSVRGDSNASQRFYEILTAGRIPLFVDTDCVLPLEERIPYDRIMLRIPWQRIHRLPVLLSDFLAAHSADSLFLIEQEARTVYDEYLRLDRYFAIVFDRAHSPYAKLLYDTSPS